MSHTKQHHPSEGRTSGGEIQGPYWKRAHQDWKFWTALILMLAGIGIYITTFDLRLEPNDRNPGQTQQPLP